MLDMRWQIHYWDTVVSTNQTAQSLPVFSVVVAKQQSAGRGRYGRVWESPKGNLYLSAVVGDYGIKTPLLAFVVGVAVADALSDYSVRLKWPNDLLLNGKKVGGILLEKTEDNRTIIGIGVNVLSCPEKGMIYETACLGNKLPVSKIEKVILNALEQYLMLFETQGFSCIRDRWMNYVDKIGSHITVKMPDKQMSGIFKELSPEGALVLETSGKTCLITVGDVFFNEGK